jgi:hypothetical protein
MRESRDDAARNPPLAQENPPVRHIVYHFRVPDGLIDVTLILCRRSRWRQSPEAASGLFSSVELGGLVLAADVVAHVRADNPGLAAQLDPSVN